MKPLRVFASRFGAEMVLDSSSIVEKSHRYYILTPMIHKFAPKDFYYAGLYLGKSNNSVFFPSFNFLNILTKTAKNQVVVNSKAAWLYVCGRDVFRKGITRIMGSKQKGSFTLVLNQFGECLGFGVTTGFKNDSPNEVAVRNLLDVGDFLRRER
jgi:ribosome biogenesis protein Nip4